MLGLRPPRNDIQGRAAGQRLSLRGLEEAVAIRCSVRAASVLVDIPWGEKQSGRHMKVTGDAERGIHSKRIWEKALLRFSEAVEGDAHDLCHLLLGKSVSFAQ